ncbi:hypothetical protein [Sciscionella marina]|uniref:hypothetical protein n=1 Tax=Sciscionella marina TaxID=508770 RepID=UPI0012F69D6A|nr:hypothetical protein [Sciscionella marina]
MSTSLSMLTCTPSGPVVDVLPEMLRVWIVEVLEQQPVQGEPVTSDRAELDRLRKENWELKQANEILKLPG